MTDAAWGEALLGVCCNVCHGEEGGGGGLLTAVVLEDAVRGMDDATLAKFIAEGLAGTFVPGFGKTLTDQQIADLVQGCSVLGEPDFESLRSALPDHC